MVEVINKCASDFLIVKEHGFHNNCCSCGLFSALSKIYFPVCVLCEYIAKKSRKDGAETFQFFKMESM